MPILLYLNGSRVPFSEEGENEVEEDGKEEEKDAKGKRREEGDTKGKEKDAEDEKKRVVVVAVVAVDAFRG